MNTPSRSGRTVARQLIPRTYRRRKKRAIRRTAKALGQTKRVKPSKQRRTPRKAAKIQKITKSKPSQKRAGGAAAQPQKLATAKKPYQKQEKRTVAKPQTVAKPAQQSQDTGMQKAIILLKKPAEEPQQKRPLELPAHAQSLLPTTPKQPKQRPATKTPERDPLDYLKDGVVEWGIKHKEEGD